MNDFWVGEPRDEGSLYLFSSNLTRQTIRTHLTIPNSIGWSPSHDTMYFTHTTEKKIYAFDYSPSSSSSPSISSERVFYHHKGEGAPDGFKIDEEGYLWSAIYGEGKVVRIHPETGEVVGEVLIEGVKGVTCVEFVGRELWITSAVEGGEGDEFGGGVFKVEVGVGGMGAFEFKLERGG